MKTNIPQPLFLTVPEAAKICGVTRNTLYTWVRKGKMSAYQTPGRTNLIRPFDLVQFMEASGLFVPAALAELAQRDELNNHPVAPIKDEDSRLGVLVVDDDAAARSVLVRALSDAYKVFQAQTGYEALHLLTLRPEIKLVCLDLRMPGQHGAQTLKEIAELRTDVKVIVVSGFSTELDEDYEDNDPVVRVLQKPVMIGYLRKQVADVVSAYNLQA